MTVYLKHTPMTVYGERDGKKLMKLEGVICCVDSKTSLKIQVFQSESSLTKLISDRVYLISGDLKYKGNEKSIIATSSSRFSKLSAAMSSKLSDMEKAEIPEVATFATFTDVKPISEALKTPDKARASIEGKIIEMSPEIKKGTGAQSYGITNALVRDKTGQVKVGLFRKFSDHAQKDLHKGMIVRCSNLRASTFQKAKNLCTAADTSIEVIIDDDLNEVDDTVPSDKEVITIIGITETFKYKGCSEVACNRKKVEDGQCLKCSRHVPDNEAKLGLRFKVALENHGGEEFCIFSSDAAKLLNFDLEDLEMMKKTETDFDVMLDCILPVKCRAKMSRSAINDIEVCGV